VRSVQGSAYVVNAEQPEAWEEIPVTPVLDVRPLLEQKLLVFADFIRLAAYGSDKFAWQSPRLCWDELKITNVTSGIIEGTGYDPHELFNEVAFRSGCKDWPFFATVASLDAKCAHRKSGFWYRQVPVKRTQELNRRNKHLQGPAQRPFNTDTRLLFGSLLPTSTNNSSRGTIRRHLHTRNPNGRWFGRNPHERKHERS